MQKRFQNDSEQFAKSTGGGVEGHAAATGRSKCGADLEGELSSIRLLRWWLLRVLSELCILHQVLVYDKTGQDIIGPLLSVKELRDLGVTLHLLLHSQQLANDFLHHSYIHINIGAQDLSANHNILQVSFKYSV